MIKTLPKWIEYRDNISQHNKSYLWQAHSQHITKQEKSSSLPAKFWSNTRMPIMFYSVHPKGDQSEGLMWSWNSNTLATWQEELTHLKRPWCWKRLRAGGEGDDRGWDGWMASPTQWKWVWVNSRSWWWTGRPGVLWFMGLQRVGHDWETKLNNLLLEVLATAIREGKGI